MNFAPALTIGILAASLYAAECNVTHTEGHSSADINQGYLATALYLYEGNYLEMSNMDKREPSVVNVSCTDTAWVYRSELDSTMIVLVSEKAVKVARVPYSDDPNGYSDSLYSVHYDDVFKDEFKRLQKAGVFKGTAEQADSLVSHVFDQCRVYYTKVFGYGGCEFNPPGIRKRNGGKDIDKADIPLALTAVVADLTKLLDTLNSCPELKFPPADTTADTAQVTPPDTIKVPDSTQAVSPQGASKAAPGLSFLKIKPRHYHVGNVLKGTPYKVFSTNGQLLEQGIFTGNVFVAPAIPVILQVNGKETLFLK